MNFDEQKFQQYIQAREERKKQMSIKHDEIKNQQTSFVIRRSNITSMLQERSKFNYMKKSSIIK